MNGDVDAAERAADANRRIGEYCVAVERGAAAAGIARRRAADGSRLDGEVRVVGVDDPADCAAGRQQQMLGRNLHRIVVRASLLVGIRGRRVAVAELVEREADLRRRRAARTAPVKWRCSGPVQWPSG